MYTVNCINFESMTNVTLINVFFIPNSKGVIGFKRGKCPPTPLNEILPQNSVTKLVSVWKTVYWILMVILLGSFGMVGSYGIDPLCLLACSPVISLVLKLV